MENKELQGGLLDLLRIDLRDHSVIAVVGGGGKTSLYPLSERGTGDSREKGYDHHHHTHGI